MNFVALIAVVVAFAALAVVYLLKMRDFSAADLAFLDFVFLLVFSPRVPDLIRTSEFGGDYFEQWRN